MESYQVTLFFANIVLPQFFIGVIKAVSNSSCHSIQIPALGSFVSAVAYPVSLNNAHKSLFI